MTEADGSVVSFGYDGQHHLTSETRTGTNPYSKSYVVDGVGNRTSQTVGGTTTTFTLDTDDELTATSGGVVNSYGYNANGEQTSRTLSGTANTLAYDYDGQLTSITSGGATTSFAYDALGRRISRTAGGTTTQFLSSPTDGHVWLESVGGTVTATYTWGAGLIRKDGEYPLFDGLGSERTVTNSSQTVTGSINYDAFGQSVGSTGSSSDPYMFAATSGYRNDGDAGLSLVGARYYDAQAGRFITRDTYLDQPPYAYCEHDPVNCLDPSGHQGTTPPPFTLDPKNPPSIGGNPNISITPNPHPAPPMLIKLTLELHMKQNYDGSEEKSAVISVTFPDPWPGFKFTIGDKDLPGHPSQTSWEGVITKTWTWSVGGRH